MKGMDEKSREIRQKRALKNERLIAPTMLVTSPHKMRLAFYPLVCDKCYKHTSFAVDTNPHHTHTLTCISHLNHIFV